jgi:ribonuclease inhibitor
MTYELDARRMGRLQVHEYLMEMLPLPDYYGRNLDALYDCLTDFCDITLTVTHSDEAPQSFDIVREVLMDAARENPDLTVIFQENDISDT